MNDKYSNLVKNNLDEKITIIPFDFQWVAMYKAESKRIQEKLNREIIAMEHIGSTAIPHIYSKPIIDIMIGVENIERSENIINALIDLGYEYFGEANVAGRLYFRIRGNKNFNLAVCDYEGKIWLNNLLFRDYLKENPDIANQYSLMKKNAFESGIDTLLKYSDIKQDFINKILSDIQ